MFKDKVKIGERKERKIAEKTEFEQSDPINVTMFNDGGGTTRSKVN